MISEWLQRISGAVPKGFSRYYVLSLISERPMTGKEIMEEAAKRSNNLWKPSPGLVYPLLGKLLQEGLIEEDDYGRYRITDKGRAVLADVHVIQGIVRKQLDVMMHFSTLSTFIAKDILERITSLGSMLAANINRMTQQERERYREFLLAQLRKLDESEARSSEQEHRGKRESIDIE
ncbi:MAG: PadR family transcriptional regulator [Candidatus Nitrosocaldus sp.]|nr:PadR family transcriptional regulator [Candidatus Nitrosocaldus sp.]MDW8000561.1 PadR family transcriptional regulator [Candidatus Nitrosocaldus sp.]